MKGFIPAAVIHNWDVKSFLRGDLYSPEHHRHLMCWCNKVNVVASLTLQREHDIRKFLKRYLNTLSEMAYRVVLTKETAEITVAKENGARAESTDKRFFLTKMRTPARYKGFVPCSAETQLT